MWRRWYHRTVDYRAIVGKRTLAEALPLAYGDAVCEWHKRFGASPPEGVCAGCGGPLEGQGVYSLHDGARLHDDGCLTRYGRRWRTAAVEGLALLGISPPPGWEP